VPLCRVVASKRRVVMRDLSAYQQLSLTYSKPTNDSQSPSAGEDLGVDQVTGVRLNKPTKRPTRAKAPRSGTGVAPLSRPASGRSLSGTRRIPARSTTRSCSGGRSCRGSGPCRFPRSWRRPDARRRPLRPPAWEKDTARFYVEGARRVGWHQPLKTPLSPNGASSYSPQDQPLFRPSPPQGDR
jgi:hypothetical protein